MSYTEGGPVDKKGAKMKNKDIVLLRPKGEPLFGFTSLPLHLPYITLHPDKSFHLGCIYVKQMVRTRMIASLFAGTKSSFYDILV